MSDGNFAINDVISITNADTPAWAQGKWRVVGIVLHPVHDNGRLDTSRRPGEIRNGGLIERGEFDPIRQVINRWLCSDNSTDIRRAHELEAALAAGPRPQAELSDQQKIFVLLAEIRRCINDDKLMPAQRKILALEEIVRLFATPPPPRWCETCRANHPLNTPHVGELATPPAPPAVIPPQDRNEQTRSATSASVPEVRPVLLPHRDIRASVQAKQEEDGKGATSLSGCDQSHVHEVEATAVIREAPLPLALEAVDELTSEIERLRAVLENPEKWMQWCDHRVLERAEKAEAERDFQRRRADDRCAAYERQGAALADLRDCLSDVIASMERGGRVDEWHATLTRLRGAP
jgi:hypothetical protein